MRGMTTAGTTPFTPDWDTLMVELHCPRCDYNVARLPQPRCPECGLTFDWQELIAVADEQVQSPLFEHQWRHRFVRSFVGTVGRALVPPLLWRRARLAVTPRVGPLIALFVMLEVLLVLVTYGGLWAAHLLAWRRRSVWLLTPIAPDKHLVELLTPAAACAVLLLVSWLGTHVFQQTLLGYRIQRGQVLRVIVLAVLPVIVLKLLAVPLAVASTLLYSPGVLDVGLLDWVGLALWVVSLAYGFQRYLRLRGGWLVAVWILVLHVLTFITLTMALVAYLRSLAPLVGPRGQTSVLYHAWPSLHGIARLLLRPPRSYW